MTATPAIDGEVGGVHGDDFAVPPLLAHGDQAGVGQIHRLIGIFADQLADSGVVVTEIPRADEEAISHRGQDRVRRPKKMRDFGQDRFARVHGPWQTAS